ncbi:WD domain-containing protein, putative [Phytophthora infestans T30-4]|uniref:WD domain-containing protein, putative n=1 Tax=Phytophthora infestans (strain T30-4) TaxID=403677 RepID=D0N9I4_PHYIT|nr:WD domain-containing protein, putative [Phytophthora infestans T30-4]EEY54472.1 WD domain-containing protein, putative [Phytophthora infestans T30-4]|eukprot:XP_002904294.1 WD domain-containing protein, putative [Phytophthora infestans T30-4]
MAVWKCHVAEKMGPITSSSCGNFLFAGADSGAFYVWDVKPGELVAVFDAHYKRVSALELTSDDSHLVTAGEDALVHVWRHVDLLDEPDAASSFQQGFAPVVSFTDHVRPVTSLHVGLGGVKARIYTSSLDRTCKIWSLNYPLCLYSVSCPSYVNQRRHVWLMLRLSKLILGVPRRRCRIRSKVMKAVSLHGVGGGAQ